MTTYPRPHDQVTTHPEYARVYHHYAGFGVPPQEAARLAYEHTYRHVATQPVPTVRPPRNHMSTPAAILLGVVALFAASCVGKAFAPVLYPTAPRPDVGTTSTPGPPTGSLAPSPSR